MRFYPTVTLPPLLGIPHLHMVPCSSFSLQQLWWSVLMDEMKSTLVTHEELNDLLLFSSSTWAVRLPILISESCIINQRDYWSFRAGWMKIRNLTLCLLLCRICGVWALQLSWDSVLYFRGLGNVARLQSCSWLYKSMSFHVFPAKASSRPCCRLSVLLDWNRVLMFSCFSAPGRQLHVPG